MNPVTLTEKAVKEIKHIMSEDETLATNYVRVGVAGGGCSGFKFTFSLDETYNEASDFLYEQDGLKVVVDKRSSLYLEGTSVDFLDSLDKRGFSFDNPSVKTKCGCGSSFTM